MSNEFDGFKNEELLPTKDKDRDLTMLDFTFLWIGMSINLTAFTLGAQLFHHNSPMTIVFAVLLAYTIVTAVLILTGDIGIVHGLPFAVYIKACFGTKGANIPAIFRAIPACFWFGFLTWVGAVALDKLMVMWIGYSNIMLLTFIFALVQIMNAAFGLKAMAKFDWIAIPALTILLSLVTFLLLKGGNMTLVDVFSTQVDNSGLFMYAVTAIAGNWITMGLNSPDLTRKLRRTKDHYSNNFYIRNRGPVIAQLVGLIIAGSAIILVGTIGAVVTGLFDPVEVVSKAIGDTPTTLFLGMATIIFAQWSTNTAANLTPAAYVIMNSLPKLNFSKAIFISGAIGLAMMPWVFADNLLWFTVLSSGLLGPIAGIMIADYYVIRKGKLNIKAFYQSDGEFKYTNGYNVKSLVIYAISTALSLIFMDYSFFVGFACGMILYLIFTKREEIAEN